MKSIGLGLGASFAVLSAATFALPTFEKVVAERYTVKKDTTIAKASCVLCHAGKTKLKEYNLYGTDLRKAMAAAKTKVLTAELLKQIEGLDSDKDGIKNGDELKAGTLPGDPKSK
jgi:hypothetical protein